MQSGRVGNAFIPTHFPYGNAIKAPARLTIDSNASENRLTESVSKYAPDFSSKVRTAAAIESLSENQQETI